MSISEIQDAIRHLQDTIPHSVAHVTFSQHGLCSTRQNYDIDIFIDGKTVYCTGECATLDEALNEIRSQVELDQWDPDKCAYCGGELDGEVCDNMACDINKEAA